MNHTLEGGPSEEDIVTLSSAFGVHPNVSRKALESTKVEHSNLYSVEAAASWLLSHENESNIRADDLYSTQEEQLETIQLSCDPPCSTTVAEYALKLFSSNVALATAWCQDTDSNQCTYSYSDIYSYLQLHIYSQIKWKWIKWRPRREARWSPRVVLQHLV